MFSSKSFANIEQFVLNLPNTNSLVGEMTTYAKTFTREMGVYQDNAKPGYTIYNLKSTQDSSGDPVAERMPVSTVNKGIALTDWLVQKAIAAAGQLYHDELLQQIIPVAAAMQASSVQLGPVQDFGGKWLPTWLSFSDDETGVTNENKIWLGIQALEAEYSDYDIVVVPPLTPLDLFFTNAANIQQLLNAITIPMRDNKIQEAKDGHPETVLSSDNYNYINPLNPSQAIPVNWPVLVYGPAGSNIDAIKDALQTYILANSTHSREEWTLRFPDIFKRTEFIIAPAWHRFAVENLQLQNGGVYSPIINTNEARELMENMAPSYNGMWIEQHLVTLGNPYRSVCLTAVGGSDNRNGLFELNQVFPDYINVSTQSPDFNRQSENTQQWAEMMQGLLILAEKLDASTTLPVGSMRVVRDGIMYAARSHDNIQYLVASKRSTLEAMGV